MRLPVQARAVERGFPFGPNRPRSKVGPSQVHGHAVITAQPVGGFLCMAGCMLLCPPFVPPDQCWYFCNGICNGFTLAPSG